MFNCVASKDLNGLDIIKSKLSHKNIDTKFKNVIDEHVKKAELAVNQLLKKSIQPVINVFD